MLLYKTVRLVLTPLVKILYRPRIIGRENIPSDNALILVGNHISYLDSILLIASTKRTVHFLAKDSLHKGIKKVIFKGIGTIPVNRNISDNDAFLKAKEVLNDNKVIGIFPEATRNLKNEDHILPFKTGAVRMARETDSYIVPFTITGKYRLFRRKINIEFYEKIKINSDDIKLENEKLMDFFRKELEKRK